MLQDLPPQRWETRAARQQIASKLGLPYHDVMQDWPWKVASLGHLQDYLQLYASSSDDERVVLMEMMLQATTDQEEPAAFKRAWHQVEELLNQHPLLHAWSVHSGAVGEQAPRAALKLLRAYARGGQRTSQFLHDLKIRSGKRSYVERASFN